jgi:GT2 family glycosyltransferase/thioesterase domain-containing protein/acyl carrier protein
MTDGPFQPDDPNAATTNSPNIIEANAHARGIRPDLGVPPVAPRTPLERDLAEIWQNLLGIDQVSVQDDFRALGGTDSLAEELFAKIEKRFGVRLPLTAIVEAPTVEQLAIRLSTRKVVSETAAHCLRAGASGRRNLFFVHNDDGETLLYLNLARALPETLSVWGLDPLADENVPIKHTRIPDMAAHYLEQITRVQPAGPYLLGGMGAGGVIAFEIALQLEAQGHTIALLALLDAADPQATRKFALQSTRRARRFLSTLKGEPEPELAAPAAEACRDPDDGAHDLKTTATKAREVAEYEISSRAKRVADRSRFLLLRQALDRQLDVPTWLQGIPVRTVYELAEESYQPRRHLRGRAALFRATNGEGADEPFIQLYRDARLGWDQRVESPLDVHDVPGGHASMLREPNVLVLAQRIYACIEREYAQYSQHPPKPATADDDDPVSAVRKSSPPPSRVLIVIVNYKSAALTVDCLKSLEPEVRDIAGARVVLVENASGEGQVLAKAIADNGWGSWVTLDISDKNGGYAHANNRAIEPALKASPAPEYIHLLNPDTRIYPGAVRALLDFMDRRPEVGIAGSSFENGDGSDWPIAFRFPTFLSELDRGLQLGIVSKALKKWVVAQRMPKKEAQIDWVPGASMMIRTQVFRDIGLMDDGYFLYYEETDFCLRARRAGWPCWYVPQSHVVHLMGQSTGVTEHVKRPSRTPAFCFESRNRYFVKNHGLAYTLGADLTFGLGFTLWRLRRVIQRKPDTDPPHHLIDFIRHSVLLERNRVYSGAK